MAYVIKQDGSAAVTPSMLKRRRALSDAMIQRGSSAAPVQHWTQAAARLANSLVGTIGQRKSDKAEKEARSASAQRFSDILGPALSGAPDRPTSLTPSEGPSPSTPYTSRVRARESASDDSARNPLSSATGRYQFTEGTWADLRKRHAGLGLTPEGRTDPAQQERAMQVFTDENKAVLGRQGIEGTDANLYAAHFLGSGDAPKVLTADDATPLANIVQPATMQSNPHLAGMTAGDFKRWTQTQMGSPDRISQPAQEQPAPTQVAQAPAAQSQAGPSMQQLMELASDPNQGAGQKAVLNAMLQQRIGQMGPKDPIKIGKTLLDPNTYQPLYQEEQQAPSSFREYGLAQQGGYAGSYADWVKSKSPQVNIGQSEYGKIPPGHELMTDPVTGKRSMSPIPGSPAAAEAEAAAKKKELGQAQKELSGGVVLEDLDRSLEMIAESPGMTTGAGGFFTSQIPGTKGFDVAQLLMGIKANIGFDRLQQMRASSQTGAALGNVTIGELQRLEAVYGSIAQSQSSEQLTQNLERLKRVFTEIVHGPEAALGSGLPGGSSSEGLPPPVTRPSGVVIQER